MRWGHVSLASATVLLAAIGAAQGAAQGNLSADQEQVAATHGSGHDAAQDVAPGVAPDWAKQGLWETALAWAERRLATCDEARAWEDAAPCRHFVAEALDQVFGLSDFKKNDRYLPMSIVAREIAKPESGWLEIGRADSQGALDEAQASANEGHPVLAIYSSEGPGHIAMILPGDSTASRSWKKRMPNAASIIGTGAERSFVGRPLSYAFSSGKAEQVMLYRRNWTAPGDTLFVEHDTATEAVATAAIEDDLLEPAAAPSAAPAETSVEDQIPDAEASAPTDSNPLDSDPLVLAARSEAPVDPRSDGQVAALGPAVPLPSEMRQDLDYLDSRKNRLTGTWCGPEGTLAAGLVRAVQIDEDRKRLVWGTLQPDQPGSFRENHAHEILGVDQDGEVLGVTVADTSAASADATVFFIFSAADTLLETHRFNHVSHDIVVKGDAWTRCS